MKHARTVNGWRGLRSGCAALAVFASVCTAATAPIPTPVTFTAIDRGDQSNIDTAREAIVRSASQWATLWRQHAGDRPLPKVDFTKSTVIAVFLGSRPTGGFAVDITGIERDGADLTVTYRETKPAADAMVSQVLTMPYHIVRIDRFPGPIHFKRTP